MQADPICLFLFFFKPVEMNVFQNVLFSTHCQDVCFSSPLMACQKLKLASLDSSKLACA